ncbi:MAG: hypothetical protein JWO78_2304 [Micavibrio sp.]|nr:hypothetical protein [Micavibrio sp.]
MAFILPYKSVMPTIDETVFVAETAAIIGDVVIGAESFGVVWLHPARGCE